jgi:leader peptidase (prepilin peptidase) / N-methyltransferase
MTDTTVALCATIGLALGPWLRAGIFIHTVAPGAPTRRDCPHCSHPLLPAGPLRSIRPIRPTGRCPACHQRVGAPPAVIELSSGALIGLLALRVHPFLVLVALSWLAGSGIVAAAVDINVHRLPNTILGPAAIAVIALLTAAAIFDHRPHQLLEALIGGAIALTSYTLLALTTSGLGLGDCKLAALLGMALGWFGWHALFAGLVLGFVLAALYLLPRTVSGRLARSDRIAFGPFMLIGAFIMVLITA